MKEFIIFSKRIAVLLLLFIIVDIAIGGVVTYLFNKQKSGKYFITSYAINSTKEDILIFGNSHAAQHFNTPLMVEKLKMSAFNFGVQGQSMLYYYPIMKSVLSHHKPELMILNLDCSELNVNSANYQRLSIFLPYFHKNSYIDSSIALIGKSEKYEAWSSLYRYNSTLGYVLFNVSGNSDNKSYKSLGFDPQYGNFCQKLPEDHKKQPKIAFDQRVATLLSSIIKDAQNAHIPLVVTTTPLLYGMGENVYQDKLRVLLKDNKVDYWDYANNVNFKGKCELFLDDTHLNKGGADLFTTMIMERIKTNNLLPKGGSGN